MSTTKCVLLVASSAVGFAIPGYPTPDYPGIPYIFSRPGNFNTRSGNRIATFYVIFSTKRHFKKLDFIA